MTTELIQNYIDPQLVILIPMLWGVGMSVKQSRISNQYIPVILLVFSCCIVMLHLTSTKFVFDVQSMSACIFAAVTQGSIIWLRAWIGYEKFLHNKEVIE